MEKLMCSSAGFAETIKETLDSGGSVPLVVSGNSMNPFLKDGKDIVWLKACTESDFKRGRILLFRRESGALVLHRIRRVLPDGELVMNGDAQYWCENIKKEQAIAAVSEVERDGKRRVCPSNNLWQFLKPLRPYIFGAWRLIRKNK